MTLATNQEIIKQPFVFDTNKKVYSLEEALYYVYTTKKDNPSLIYEYLNTRFVDWVENILKQPFLASKLEEAKTLEEEADRLEAYLSIVSFIKPAELTAFIRVVRSWNKTNAGKVENNTGVNYALKGDLDEALLLFEKALESEPENRDTMLNIASIYIQKEEYETAFTYLNKAENGKENADADFFYGQISAAKGNYETAIDYFENAISLKYEPNYFYELSRIYVETRRYDMALKTLEAIIDKDATFYREQASVYSYTDLPFAILAIENAVKLEQSTENFTLLAKYYRLNKDFDNARLAITKALSINNECAASQIEEAKIRKALGDLGKYQKTMENVLNRAKEDYRVKLYKGVESARNNT
ncbi:MAG: tetratricopeptide repeat protein [Defluviitaleaceae bacterium]|nr:tetratricopeptide repeat protein [Defluviitaleaceae bacterium]